MDFLFLRIVSSLSRKPDYILHFGKEFSINVTPIIYPCECIPGKESVIRRFHLVWAYWTNCWANVGTSLNQSCCSWDSIQTCPLNKYQHLYWKPIYPLHNLWRGMWLIHSHKMSTLKTPSWAKGNFHESLALEKENKLTIAWSWSSSANSTSEVGLVFQLTTKL